MFNIFIQDEGAQNAHLFDAFATEAQALDGFGELVIAMETTFSADATEVALAELDIDGKVLAAEWHTVPGSEIRSLVAIVEEV